MKISVWALLVLTVVYMGCSPKSDPDRLQLASAGLSAYCGYEPLESFDVYDYSTDGSGEEVPTSKFEYAALLLSERDYQRAMQKIQQNPHYSESRTPDKEQFVVFKMGKEGQILTSCIFDQYNKGITYFHREYSEIE